MDTVVGVMYCKNEVDVLPITIADAITKLDSLFISDDGSTDGSWEIIKYFKQQYPDKIEHIQQKPNPMDQGQRQDLLNEIRRRYKPESTWVQAVDADMILHTTNIHSLIVGHHRENVSVKWGVMNAVRDCWDGIHQFYPNWPEDIRQIMPKFHRIETVPYTYRPLPDLYFTSKWKPWPSGFGKYVTIDTNDRGIDKDAALLLHYGYRGPTHMMTKWQRGKKDIVLYKTGEDYTSIDTLYKTNPYFNGQFNRDTRHVFDSPEEAWLHSWDL